MQEGKVAAILEDLRSQFRVFGEGQDDLRERIIKVEKKLVDIEEDIQLVKIDIAFIKTELKKYTREEEFNALEKRVVLLERKFSRL